jgi:hypothetical protein
VRRVYPQIYNSNEKLLVSPDQVLVTRDDFMTALQGEVPGGAGGRASQDSGATGWPAKLFCLRDCFFPLRRSTW